MFLVLGLKKTNVRSDVCCDLLRKETPFKKGKQKPHLFLKVVLDCPGQLAQLVRAPSL